MTDGDGRAENQWRIEDSTFLRLIPGPSEEQDCRGGRMRLISLELYEEGTLITWHLHSLPQAVFDEAAKQPDVINEIERYVQYDEERELTDEQRAHNLAFYRSMTAQRAILPDRVAMTDDRERTYISRWMQTSGTRNFRCLASLMPGLAPDASHLTIDFDGVIFEIDLT